MPSTREVLALLARVTPADDLSTGALARRSGWSAGHLHRAFRRTTHETPKAWATRVKLAHAVHLLRTTDRPVAQVAADCGFASHAVFTRAVRRALGTTPTALRQAPGGAHLTHAACLTLYHLALEPRSPAMSVTVTVQHRAPQPALVLRREVPPSAMQAALAECLPAVFAHCQQHGIAFAGPPFTRYLAMRRGTFLIEAGMPVVEPGTPADGIEAVELPGGDVAVAVHVGPYNTLGDTHEALEAWAKAEGRAPGGGPWESYLTDPGQVPDPAQWQTEVCLPLA